MLIIGLVLLVGGSSLLVDGASDIARRSGISEFVIGITIVGIGTSTPEMVVSFLGALRGSADLAVGNIIGSNIFNTLLILGVTAMILPMEISRHAFRRDIPINIAVACLLVILGLDHTIFGGAANVLGRLDGAILLLLFAAYILMSLKEGREEGQDNGNEADVPTSKCVWIPLLMVIGGLAGLVTGGRLFVDNAVDIARAMGWSEKFIAITILAGGTSMPELVTCVVAAFKKKDQLALGNILGSNISNVLLILGGSALIHPLSMENITMTDLGFFLLSAIVLFIANFVLGKRLLSRIEGFVLLALEAAYMYLLITAL